MLYMFGTTTVHTVPNVTVNPLSPWQVCWQPDWGLGKLCLWAPCRLLHPESNILCRLC